MAASLQATSNRFQEAAGFPVLASGFTIGATEYHGAQHFDLLPVCDRHLQPALKVAKNCHCSVPSSVMRLSKAESEFEELTLEQSKQTKGCQHGN